MNQVATDLPDPATNTAVPQADIGRSGATRWTNQISWAAVIFGAAPLVLIRPAFLQDWPNHITRVEIIASLLRGESFWQPFYTLNGPFVPNMALDLGMVVPMLAGVPPLLASSLFLVFTYGLVISGGVALARSFGAYDRTTPLLLVLLFYSGALFYGLVNYLVGLGGMLWVLALWYRTRTTWLRYGLTCLGVAAVFFAHLIAATLLVLLILAQEAWLVWRAPRRGQATLGRNATGLAGLAVLAVLAALSTAGHDGASGSLFYIGQPSIRAILAAKASLLVHTLVDGGGMIGAGLLLFGLLCWGAGIVLGGRLRPPPGGALLLLVPALLFVAAPYKFGEAALLDYRMVIVGMLLMVATVRIVWRSRVLAALAWVALLAAVLGRTVILTAALAHRADTLAAFERAVPVMPADSMLLMGYGSVYVPWETYWDPPIINLAAWAARSGVFVPSVFAVPSQHMLVLRPPYRALRQWLYVDTKAHWDETRQRLQPVCAAWRAAHAGSVFLLIAYPSTEIDRSVLPGRVLAGYGEFRLVNACAA